MLRGDKHTERKERTLSDAEEEGPKSMSKKTVPTFSSRLLCQLVYILFAVCYIFMQTKASPRLVVCDTVTVVNDKDFQGLALIEC